MHRRSRLRPFTAELEVSPEAFARVPTSIIASETDRGPVKSPPQATPQPKTPQREKSDFLLGGTEYMFDSGLPLPLRLLSCFHLVTPPRLLWAVYRLGYDRRALRLQVALTAGLLPAYCLVLYLPTDFLLRRWSGPRRPGRSPTVAPRRP